MDTDTTLRPCIGCDRELDIAAHYAGTSDQGKWWRTEYGYQCDGCRASGHIPHWKGAGGKTAVATCSCGWASEMARATLGELAADWSRHWKTTRNAA